MLKKIILLIGMLCLLQGQALAAEYVADGVGATEKAALQDAFRTAMEHVIGMKIDSRTYARNHQIIRDQILAHTEGYVRSYEILRRSTSGELVTVRCRVVIDTEPNAELMTKLEKISAIKIGLNDPRIAVLIINGDELGKNADEAAAVTIASVLANNGFSHILDTGQMARSQEERFKAAAFDGDYATIALLGMQEDLDYIIVGTIKANNADINIRTSMVSVKSARAFLNEKVIKAGTGMVVQSGQYQACGTDIIAENARQTAKKQVSSKAGSGIASALLNNAALPTKNITVYVHGLKDHSELQAYEAMLHDLIGVTDVYIRNFINGSAVLDLSFGGDTEELAVRIRGSEEGFVSLVARLTDSTIDLVIEENHK